MTNAGQSVADFANIKALNACGCIVELKFDDFMDVLDHQDTPLILVSRKTSPLTVATALTSHRGFIFWTRLTQLFRYGRAHELIEVKRVWIPH